VSAVPSQWAIRFISSDRFDINSALRDLDRITVNEGQLVQVEVSVSNICENTPSMIEMLRFLEDRGFTPVAFFRLTDCVTEASSSLIISE
jgi:hypothetical protein